MRVADDTTIELGLEVKGSDLTEEQAVELMEKLKCFLVCAAPVRLSPDQVSVKRPVITHPA
jgi:hypothetical protein